MKIKDLPLQEEHWPILSLMVDAYIEAGMEPDKMRAVLTTDSCASHGRRTMPGHPDPHIYLTDNYPTPKAKRLTYVETVRALITAGWPKNRQTLTTAAAVIAAESARDPRAYLAYIDLGRGQAQREGHGPPQEDRRARPHHALTSYRQKIEELGAEVVRADCGLFQVAKTFDWGEQLTPDITVTELMKSDVNLRRGLHMWKNRGWQPWAAYTTAREGEDEPPYKRFIPSAEIAVNKVLG